MYFHDEKESFYKFYSYSCLSEIINNYCKICWASEKIV